MYSLILQDIFGELSFLDEDLAASASVVTDGPVEVYLTYLGGHILGQITLIAKDMCWITIICTSC